MMNFLLSGSRRRAGTQEPCSAGAKRSKGANLQRANLGSKASCVSRRRPPQFPNRDLHADWSISLGNGATALGQFPAKFTFDTTATPFNALTPKSITAFTTSAPVNGTGTASDLAFGATTDTLSSPYIDYADDTAYVGNDAGALFRFKNVFCTTATCGTSLPSLDTSWGGGTGSVTVCGGKLTGPVQDFYTLNVFVGCSDGKVYGFNSSGSPLTIPSIAVGNGSATGGSSSLPSSMVRAMGQMGSFTL
jgi:hypothetical protein